MLHSTYLGGGGSSKFVGANFFPAKNPVDARREVVARLRDRLMESMFNRDLMKSVRE